MAKITGADVSSFTLVVQTDRTTAMVSEGVTDLSEDIQSLEWGTEVRDLDTTGLGDKYSQHNNGKKDASLTLNLFSQDTGGTLNTMKNGGEWRDDIFGIYCEYGGSSGDDRTLKFIATVGSTRTSIDADGNLLTVVTMRNAGDKGILDE